eukprot:CAMPEP_0198295722 /NCGR_PEP_ID=MMETSP1449-20131203/29214_1 /TAXON_ID=420275 /ORGANISM="Attheya septentrionalis, Strain CCMP2084" /LENGTH=454 /DNA_ID=CAMNT_0043996115 /DNA_START=26 /DNA_END=1390 /DNA_ORIENTATION=+
MTPRYITLDLIRKRSEHNEGLVSTLEELSLHQEELEAIGPVLGRTCGKTLQILLLQNNVISRMEPSSLRSFKCLEYLNLALNNISAIEGLHHLQWTLEKLDLTLNFIDVDTFADSVTELAALSHLKDLCLMGNPCAGWKGYRPYLLARLPHLRTLDGEAIGRSERIRASQTFGSLETELHELANACKTKKALEQETKKDGQPQNDNDVTHHSPETRVRQSREMARHKAEKESLQRANYQPKKRDEEKFSFEHKNAIEMARQSEDDEKIRNCNEGKWEFTLDEETRPGYFVLDVTLQKYLSTSLVDVDVHPTFVRIVIKSKLLRLVLPCEVQAKESIAQRSATTGHLVISMPKVQLTNNHDNAQMISLPSCSKQETTPAAAINDYDATMGSKLTPLKGPVQIEGLVKIGHGGIGKQEQSIPQTALGMKVIRTTRISAINTNHDEDDGEEHPPPLF